MHFLSLCNDTNKQFFKDFLNLVKLLKNRKEKLSERQSEAHDKHEMINNEVGKAERQPLEAWSQATPLLTVVPTLGRHHVCLSTKFVTGSEMGKINVERGERHEPWWLVEPDRSSGPSTGEEMLPWWLVEPGRFSGPSIAEKMLAEPEDSKAFRRTLHCWENRAGQCGGKSGMDM